MGRLHPALPLLLAGMVFQAAARAAPPCDIGEQLMRGFDDFRRRSRQWRPMRFGTARGIFPA